MPSAHAPKSRALAALAALLSTLVTCPLGCSKTKPAPPRQPAPAPSVPPPPAAEPAAAKALDAPALQERLGDLQAMQARMKAVIDKVKPLQAKAAALKARLDAVDTQTRKTHFPRLMAEVGKELRAADLQSDPALAALLKEARAMDADLRPLLSPVRATTTNGEADAAAQTLAEKVHQQQKVTKQLAQATRVAFRTVTSVRQLELAIPRLETLARKAQ